MIHSPLIFQGGNLLAVRLPASGERILLVGEAEVYRNTALGLSQKHVLEAFRVEFGVDRCVVLPGVSFHVDFDVSVRACGGQLLAFVNDTAAATKMILELGVSALQEFGALDGPTARQAHEALAANQVNAFLEIIGQALQKDHVANGGSYSAALAKAFSAGPLDSAVGNLQRFLLAADILASTALSADQLPTDPLMRAHIASFVRRHQDPDGDSEPLRSRVAGESAGPRRGDNPSRHAAAPRRGFQDPCSLDAESVWIVGARRHC